ncbi:hypothetical protein [Luteimonas abyssi]|uniref:hypothetical protein n=1 Tax=Luteimonas abyssi TaxID=1247514 RepID=UPI000737BB35|nr:hypothetical protein [Luteimonas abyssi]
MRLESVRAGTAAIAAVALWALLVWVLGLAGLGGRVTPLDDDPTLLQALPQAADPADARLGPLPQYAAIGDRPLFAEDRRPHPFSLEGTESEGAAPDFDMVLTSVLITPSFEMAIVQPRDGGDALRVRVGEAPRGFGNWSLRSVAPRSAVFAGPDGEQTLALRVFDGQGGQAPTPMAPPPPSDGGPALPLPPPRPSVGQAQAQAQAQEAARRAAAPDAPVAQNGASPQTDSPAVEGEPGTDPTPASQAEAIRRRIEARRARLRAEQATQQQNP